MFRHPKYYKELRKRALDERNKTDQAISKQQATASSTRSPGSGPKQQASSAKLTDPQATSDKHQAPRHKRQA
jgi:hypothetical protein